MRETHYWLLKTEPDMYSYADLERDGATTWDGVANNAALKFMRAAQPGDQALIYHTGDERRAVGIAEITSAAYPDPRESDPKLLVFDVKALRPLVRPITLMTIKADPQFAAWELVRQARLSVVPVPKHIWDTLLHLASE